MGLKNSKANFLDNNKRGKVGEERERESSEARTTRARKLPTATWRANKPKTNKKIFNVGYAALADTFDQQQHKATNEITL